MAAHEVESGEIADPVVERRRAPEVGEQDRQAGDLEALLGIERAAAIEIAERLVAEQPRRGEKRPSPADDLRPSLRCGAKRLAASDARTCSRTKCAPGPGCILSVPL